MDSKEQTNKPHEAHEAHETEEPKDLRKANENIRKSQGDDALEPADTKKAGNRPAFDRDR